MRNDKYTENSKFDYMFDGKMTVILGYFDPNDLIISIPPLIEGAPVGAIGFGAFSLCNNLRRVELPETLTSIENGAFRNCDKMTHITLPPKMESIGALSFAGCTGLKKVTMPNTLERVDINSFQGCINLMEIEIYNSETDESRVFTIAKKSDVARWFYVNACLRAMDKRGSYMEKFDATFLEVADEDDRFEVAAFRLGDPWRLENNARKIYLDAVSNSIEHWIYMDNIERLTKIGEFGCIEESDIDYYIELASKRRGDCTAFLLKYKDENFNRRRYDFTL